MKKLILLIVGVMLVLGGAGTCAAGATTTGQWFDSGPFDSKIEYMPEYQLARVEWTTTFTNKQNRVIEVQYQYKVSYHKPAGYDRSDYTYLGAIHRVRVQANSYITVHHTDFVPYSAIQNDWYEYCGWLWNAHFDTPLLDVRP